MKEPRFDIALTPTAEKIKASFDGHLLIVAQTGFGKSTILRNLLLSAAIEYKNNLAVIVLDPKRVSFLGWKKRAEVFTRAEQYIPVLQSIKNEMDRRYQRMLDEDVSSLRLTSECPRIVLVIDELPAFMNSQPTKAAKDEVVKLLTEISQMGRQANITLLFSAQTIGTDVLPSAVRSAFSQRLIGKLQGNEQISMASAGREEECRADLLYLQGEMFALTTETFGQFVRCRGRYRSEEEERAILANLAADKPILKCLDWENPSFLG